MNTCSIDDLPDDLLDSIFLYLPGRDLCRSCILVSKRWHRIIDNKSFWIQKCLTNLNLIKCLKRSQQADVTFSWQNYAKLVYCSNFFDRNLLKNPRGNKQFDYWCVCNETTKELRDSRPIRSSEKLKEICTFYKLNQIVHLNAIKPDVANQTNSKKLKKCLPIPNWRVEITENHFTRDIHLFDSFKTKGFGEKMQLIDLAAEGYGLYPHFMTELKPDIEVYEYYRVHNSECCEYSLVVYLMTGEYEFIDSFLFRDKTEQNHSDWKCVYHKFLRQNLKSSPIVRFILFYHSGKVRVIFKRFMSNLM